MKRIVRVFLAGLFALLPLVATIAATIWVVRFAIQYVGPNSTFGNLLTSIGLSFDANALAPYMIGLLVVIGIIWAFGLLVETRVGPWFTAFMENWVLRIPIIGSVYQLSRRFIAVVDSSEENGMKNMEAVWCFFGSDTGAAVLALLPSKAPVTLGSEEYVAILVPSAPVPVGGALIYVPTSWVKPAQVGIDELISIYVSMGMTPPTPIAAQEPTGVAATPPPAIRT